MASGWLSFYESRLDSNTAFTTYFQAGAHAGLGNARAVIEHSERVLGFADSRDRATLTFTAPTLALRAQAQRDLGEFGAAIAVCDDLIQRFGSREEWPFSAVTAQALHMRGSSRALLGDDPGAIRDYDEVADRFGDSELPDIQGSLVAVLLSRGLACRRLGDTEEEIRSYDAVIERFAGSDAPDRRRSAAQALSWKCMAQADIGLADEALASCRTLDGVARAWPSDEDDPLASVWVAWLKWRAEGARSLALAVQENHRASLDSFQAAYAVFLADDEVTTQEMLDLVANLVARGVAPLDLLGVLSSDTARSASLRPLIVALHQQAGDRVRAPREIEEVAADIRERFHKAEER